jgi:prefoldin subunit 5
MGLMLPDHLIWLFDKLGYDWPDIDEDDLTAAGNLTRSLKSDLETIIQTADQKISVEVPNSATGKAALAYTAAWETNRDQNLNQMLDILVPVPTGLDISAGVVVGLKGKMIAQITIDVATMLPLIAAGPLGAAAFIAKKVASRIIMGVMVDMAVNKAVEAASPYIIEPLTEQIPAIIQKILDAPEMEDTGSEPGELKLDLDVLENIQEAMDQCSSDIESAISEFMSDIAALTFTS